MTTLSSSITPVTKIVKVMILIRKASLTSNKSYVRACEGQPGGAHTSCFHIHCNLEATRHQDPDWRLRLEAPQQEACACLLGHRNLSLARSWQRVRKPLLRITFPPSKLSVGEGWVSKNRIFHDFEKFLRTPRGSYRH